MTARSPDSPDVLIVGAGPVGLLLGCLLLRRGIACRVLERRPRSGTHSRSIGIHPVALEIFQELGIADRFVALGHRIERGQAWVNRRHVGTISFEGCPSPFRYILTLPQYVTESLLERHLSELDATALLRGADVAGGGQAGDHAFVDVRRDGRERRMRARLVVGCDGMHSTVRRMAGIGFRGADYPDVYVMGDFPDTGTRPDAEIHLHPEGLVESIPLPGDRRRWVVKTRILPAKCRREDVVTPVRGRLGVDLSRGVHYMLSAFRVQHYLAETFVRGRFVLTGDAAHVISPIGGQGMNLGWLDARCLAGMLGAAAGDGAALKAGLERYAGSRRAAAEKARRRGEFNMRLGRAFRWPLPRHALVRAMLSRPAANRMARVFTMRGLG
jgi:2-polyprenyl-6-methoxyphenol hydroxylase-like FAD-dependent oxidoreductase